VTPEPLPEPEVEIYRTKPEPAPEPVVTPGTSSTTIVQVTPAPVQQTTPAEPTKTKKQLPKTAGQLDLFGLIGLASLTGGYLTRYLRK